MSDDLPEFRAKQIEQSEPWEELSVEGNWIHLLRSMFTGDNPLAAKIGSTPFFIYAAIKCHADINTGSTFPAIETLARQTGVSQDTVMRSIKTLVEVGLVQVKKHGKNNHYSLIEHVPLKVRKSGEPFGSASVAYEPKQFQGLMDELKSFARSGNVPDNKAITINITINAQNITQGTGSTVNIATNMTMPGTNDKASPSTEGNRELKQKLP